MTRGQTLTEVALGLLVLVPVLLGGLYLAEAAALRLEAAEASTEPLWDATAWAHQAYTGQFDRTPDAVGRAVAGAAARQLPRRMLFNVSRPASVTCVAGAGLGVRVPHTDAAYRDNGGIACQARLEAEPHGLTRLMLDAPRGGFFSEPLVQLQRSFRFCANEACEPWKLAIGDWGLTALNGEAEQCRLTSIGCANPGYFAAARSVYQAHRTSQGTSSRAHLRLLEGVVVAVPHDVASVTEFQMSFRGEESDEAGTPFMESVPVSEGESHWRTSPALGQWGSSHAMRQPRFLGR